MSEKPNIQTRVFPVHFSPRCNDLPEGHTMCWEIEKGGKWFEGTFIPQCWMEWQSSTPFPSSSNRSCSLCYKSIAQGDTIVEQRIISEYDGQPANRFVHEGCSHG